MGDLYFTRLRAAFIWAMVVGELRFVAYSSARYAHTRNYKLGLVKPHLASHYAAVNNTYKTIQLQIELNSDTSARKEADAKPNGPVKY